MDSFREKAIASIASDRVGEPVKYTEPLGELFGADVFNENAMQQYLAARTLKQYAACLSERTPIPPELAEEIADAMKAWALERGATHYSHWFLPLTGSSAEKHDSFVEPDHKGGMILKFSGKNLIVGEPDASSLPNGGLRSTFEARGYTAWDPSSPAFIRRGNNTATLCIPTVFCSCNGEVLDKKTPLLRSIQAVSTQAERLARCFGVEGKAVLTLGAEQEYFLIDKRLYFCRPDLVQTGRTLFGARPPKHQQLGDHYFSPIKPRVLNFMAEVDHELWRLGIPAKTRHNETAPAQFELAPVFEESNLACDHNMIIMEVLREVADRHGLVCLLHEKPFASINGSGKHNNWSISIGNVNLLDQGKDPKQNALFLTTLCAVIEAVSLHGDLLRASTIGAGNDHRLGAAEAPPAIMSIFLGEQLSGILEEIETGDKRKKSETRKLRIGVDTLPQLPVDSTDRNRTSPFAFTGTKFEFRAPGASSSCATPNTVINTIVAESFDRIAAILEKAKPEEFNTVLSKVLRDILKKHKRVLFNGDNYTLAWVQEAQKRGLPNLRTTPEALEPLLDEKNIALYEKYKVFTRTEVLSRYEVFLREYKRRIHIEGELSLSLARTVIYPAVMEEINKLTAGLVNCEAMKLTIAGGNARKMIDALSPKLAAMLEECDALESALVNDDPAPVIEAMNNMRKEADALELLVDDRLWPLPKYRELLFIY
ncbi:MAG: glutamine synthetase type III [Lentisphaerae bacterium]|nr:glutamine synthetase type III [Lentisphaerota bacterium]